jgi:outer membrane lipoprotein SlyB
MMGPLRITTFFTLALVLLAACGNNRHHGNSGIIIDTKNTDMSNYQQDLAECEQYTEQVATGKHVTSGAVGGAVLGGLVGAAVGNSTTAQRGAGAGAITGTAKGVSKSEQEKSRVLRNCLRGRGYKILN